MRTRLGFDATTTVRCVPVVALHLDPKEPGLLLGVWSAPADGSTRPRCFYSNPEAEAIGRSWVEAKPPDFDWRRYCVWLAAKLPYEAWWEATEVDDDTDLESLFVVLSAQMLASAAALHGTADHGFTVNMLSPELEARLGLTVKADQYDLALREVACEHDVPVAADDAFQRRARILQSLWRQDHGLAAGSRTRSADSPVLGSRLQMPDAKADLSNFLTPAIREVVYNEILAPEHDAAKLYAQPRIFDNLLSSQPLCFNLFGELAQDLNLATGALRIVWPERIDQVVGIDFEWSPGRGDPKYLGNRSAFDIYVQHTVPGGGDGFIGIEVKYHENLTGTPAAHKPIYDQRSSQSGVFQTPLPAELHSPPLQQIWLDHLLALSMRLANPNWSAGLFAFLFPKANLACLNAAQLYRWALTDQATFAPLTLEELATALRTVGAGTWIEDFWDRYLDFGRVDQLVRQHL